MNKKSLAVRVLATFVSLLCLGQIDFMFWSLYWQVGGWNWVDIQIAGTPILQVSLYNSFCIVWLGVFLSLILLWLNYLWNWGKCQNAYAP